MAKVSSSPSGVMAKGSPGRGEHRAPWGWQPGRHRPPQRDGERDPGRDWDGGRRCLTPTPVPTSETSVVHQHVQPLLLPQHGLGEGTHRGQRAGVQQPQQHCGVAGGRPDLLHGCLAPLLAPARQDGAGVPAGQVKGYALADPCSTQSGRGLIPARSPQQGVPGEFSPLPPGSGQPQNRTGQWRGTLSQAAQPLSGAWCRTQGAPAPEQGLSAGGSGAGTPGLGSLLCSAVWLCGDRDRGEAGRPPRHAGRSWRWQLTMAPGHAGRTAATATATQPTQPRCASTAPHRCSRTAGNDSTGQGGAPSTCGATLSLGTQGDNPVPCMRGDPPTLAPCPPCTPSPPGSHCPDPALYSGMQGGAATPSLACGSGAAR